MAAVRRRIGDCFLTMETDVPVFDIHRHPDEAAVSAEGLEQYLAASHMQAEDKNRVRCYYYPDCDQPLTLEEVRQIVSPEFYARYDQGPVVDPRLSATINAFNATLQNTATQDGTWGMLSHSTMCPFCLTFVGRENGCRYMKHTQGRRRQEPYCDPKLQVREVFLAYRSIAKAAHEELSARQGFEPPIEITMEFCVECGRPCANHMHFTKSAPYRIAGAGIACGGRPELFARILAVREVYRRGIRDAKEERRQAALAANAAASDPQALEKGRAIYAAHQAANAAMKSASNNAAKRNAERQMNAVAWGNNAIRPHNYNEVNVHSQEPENIYVNRTENRTERIEREFLIDMTEQYPNPGNVPPNVMPANIELTHPTKDYLPEEEIAILNLVGYVPDTSHHLIELLAHQIENLPPVLDHAEPGVLYPKIATIQRTIKAIYSMDIHNEILDIINENSVYRPFMDDYQDWLITRLGRIADLPAANIPEEMMHSILKEFMVIGKGTPQDYANAVSSVLYSSMQNRIITSEQYNAMNDYLSSHIQELSREPKVVLAHTSLPYIYKIMWFIPFHFKSYVDDMKDMIMRGLDHHLLGRHYRLATLFFEQTDEAGREVQYFKASYSKALKVYFIQYMMEILPRHSLSALERLIHDAIEMGHLVNDIGREDRIDVEDFLRKTEELLHAYNEEHHEAQEGGRKTRRVTKRRAAHKAAHRKTAHRKTAHRKATHKAAHRKSVRR